MTDLDRPLTVREFREFRAELEARFATKEELEALRGEMATGFADMRAYVEFSTDELKRHFDIVTESFRDQFANLLRLDARFDHRRTTTLEVGQRTLETRVTRLESRRKKPH